MYKIFMPLASAACFAVSANAQSSLPPAPMDTVAGGLSQAPASLASGSTQLSLQEALSAALDRHPDLLSAQWQALAMDGVVQQSEAWSNPSIGIGQEDTRRNTRSTTLQVSQLIELGGKRQARIEFARRGRDVAQAELAQQRAQVRATTIQAFFDALAAQEHEDVAKESLGIATRAAEAIARRVSAGKVSPTEQTRAQVAQAQVAIELRQAQAGHANALSALAVAMGYGNALALRSQRLQGQVQALPEAPDTGTLLRQLEQSPQLRRAHLEIQRAQAGYDLELKKPAPDLTVSVGAKRSEELQRSQPLIGLSLSIPIFDRNQGAQLEALRRRQAAEASAQALDQRLQAQAIQAAEQLRARADEAQMLRDSILPSARLAFDATSRGYELGKFSFLDVLDAQRTLLQARVQHLNALAQGHRAAADLERLLGAELP